MVDRQDTYRGASRGWWQACPERRPRRHRRAAALPAIAAALPAIAAVCAAAFSGGAHAQLFGLADYTGEETFQRFCASCHGSAGEGDGPVAATLAVAVPDLTRLAERRGGEFPAADVREIIDGRAVVVAHGPRVMPVWGYEFWIEEGADVEAEAEARRILDRLVRYIESLQDPEHDPAIVQ